MKKIFFYITFALIAISCTDRGGGDDFKEINLHFRNTAIEPLTVEMYAEGVLRKSEIIGAMETGSANQIYASNFNNFAFSSDSLVIKYQNGMGYICSPTSNLCIYSKPNPFYAQKEDFIKGENEHYYYILSQENYNEALDID